VPTPDWTRNISWFQFYKYNLSYLHVAEFGYMDENYRQNHYAFWRDYFPTVSARPPSKHSLCLFVSDRTCCFWSVIFTYRFIVTKFVNRITDADYLRFFGLRNLRGSARCWKFYQCYCSLCIMMTLQYSVNCCLSVSFDRS